MCIITPSKRGAAKCRRVKKQLDQTISNSSSLRGFYDLRLFRTLKDLGVLRLYDLRLYDFTTLRLYDFTTTPITPTYPNYISPIYIKTLGLLTGVPFLFNNYRRNRLHPEGFVASPPSRGAYYSPFYLLLMPAPKPHNEEEEYH